jgi:hypothetical protein
MPAITQYRDFLNKQLEQKLPGVLMRRYPGLPFANGQYLPAIGDLAIGAQYLTKEVMEQFGEAQIYSETSSDLPTISTTVDELGYRIVTFVSGVKWNYAELEHASFANVDIVSRRTQFLPRVFDEAIQKFVLAGNTNLGITGFLNNPDVPAGNDSYDPNTGDADDAMDFVYRVMTAVPNRTNLTAESAVMLVPAKLRQKWARLVLSGTSVTVLEHIISNYGSQSGGSLRAIVGINEMRSDILEAYGVNAPGTNKDMVMVAPVDPTAADRRFNARRALPLEYNDTLYKQFYLQSTSEVRFERPDEFQIFNIAKL